MPRINTPKSKSPKIWQDSAPDDHLKTYRLLRLPGPRDEGVGGGVRQLFESLWKPIYSYSMGDAVKASLLG